MDLVTRDEFEAVKAMAAKARAEQEDLARRVVELEGLLAAMRKPETPRPSVSDQS
jgi:BMFP domain-containing protein YqiC